MLMTEFHESPWSGHWGTWATFKKLKERYSCPRMFKNMHHFMATCESCQVHFGIRHRDKLHDLPANHSLQVDGRLSDDANGCRIDEIPSDGERRPHILG